MTEVRRVAIVGCGGIARAHAAAIEASENLELVAVVDSDRDALAAAEREFGTQGFTTVDEALEAVDLDAACVATPPATHRPIAEALLASGVDVLCEKPLATSVADARALVRAAERFGRRLAVSAKFRHVADLLEAGQRVRAGEIGRPLGYAVTFCAPVNVRGRWPSDRTLSGGGVLMDNGPHAFDVLSHFIDETPSGLRACFAEPSATPPVEDTATILGTTADGAVVRIELSWTYFSKDLDYLVVQGADGTLCVGWTGGRLRRHGDREWSVFGSGYDKALAFSGVWNAFGNGAEIRSPSPVEALELIERVYALAQLDE